MSDKTSKFLYFSLGLLVADLIYSVYFYFKKEVIVINNYLIQPNFFLLVVFLDIIVIALLVRFLNRK